MYLSRSAFLVSFTDPNKELLNVKSMFKFNYCGHSVYEIYKFITFLGIEILVFFKQFPLKFMCGSEWWSTKVCTKFLSCLVKFSILSSDIPLDFHKQIGVVIWKYWTCFILGTNTK